MEQSPIPSPESPIQESVERMNLNDSLPSLRSSPSHSSSSSDFVLAEIPRGRGRARGQIVTGNRGRGRGRGRGRPRGRGRGRGRGELTLGNLVVADAPAAASGTSSVDEAIQYFENLSPPREIPPSFVEIPSQNDIFNDSYRSASEARFANG